MQVIKALELPYVSEQPIYIGDWNIEYMKTDHATAYDAYRDQIYDVVQDPDHVMKHPHNGFIQYVKELSERVVVAVRPTRAAGRLIICLLYTITDDKFDKYKENRMIAHLLSHSDLEHP